MLARLRAHLGFANVVSLAALFVALGGVAYALETNSVKSKHIVNDQVKGVDVRDADLTGSDVEPASLTGAHLTSSSGTNGFISANLGSVPAHSCVAGQTYGTPGEPDLLLVAASNPAAAAYAGSGGLVVSGIVNDDDTSTIKVCNVTAGAIDPPNQFFAVLPVEVN